MDRGLTLVRPLEGGLDGWAGEGFEIERELVPLGATGSWTPAP